MSRLMANLSIKTGIVVLIFLLSFLPVSGFSDDRPVSGDALGLSAEERGWIRNHPSIKIAGPKWFPPFHYYDPHGELKGISADYIFRIMNQLGVELEIQAGLPWHEVLERIAAQQIDLIPCIARTAERESFIAFSTPYISFPLVILNRKDAPFIGGIQDLYHKKIAVIEKNAVTDWLARDQIEFEPVYVDSPFQKLEAVSLGKADAGIENLAAASYIIQNYGWTNIKVAAPTPFGNYDLHMGVRKDLPELLGIINKAIGRLSPEQQMQIRSKWLSVRYEHGLRKSDILKWVILTAAAAAVLILVILGWNRRLNAEAAKRKKLIKELEAALAEIKTLRGIVPICSSCKKIRDDTGYWNQLETFIEKHSDASFSHSMCPECMEKHYGGQDWFIKRKESG